MLADVLNIKGVNALRVVKLRLTEEDQATVTPTNPNPKTKGANALGVLKLRSAEEDQVTLTPTPTPTPTPAPGAELALDGD